VNDGTLAGSSFAINTATITNATAGASFQRYELVYTSPVVLTAGTTYFLNFDCEAPNGGRIYIETSQGGSAYSNGNSFRDGSAQGRDVVFELWGQ
jgi:hypothetical protein